MKNKYTRIKIKGLVHYTTPGMTTGYSGHKPEDIFKATSVIREGRPSWLIADGPRLRDWYFFKDECEVVDKLKPTIIIGD